MMFRTERLLKRQLKGWIDTVAEAAFGLNRDSAMYYRAREYRIPDGRIIPRNETERELYAVYKEIKSFVRQYAQHPDRITAPFGVGEVLAEKCKQALNNQRPTKETFDDL